MQEHIESAFYSINPACLELGSYTVAAELSSDEAQNSTRAISPTVNHQHNSSDKRSYVKKKKKKSEIKSKWDKPRCHTLLSNDTFSTALNFKFVHVLIGNISLTTVSSPSASQNISPSPCAGLRLAQKRHASPAVSRSPSHSLHR